MRKKENKYLSFVDNDVFIEAIKHVRGSLDDALLFEKSVIQSIKDDDIFSSKLFSNSIDPFSMQYGMIFSSDEAWLETEVRRQLYKTFEQKIGEFHQMLLGGVEGWNDLGVGDETKVDLCNDDETIFLELKNKHNTCNDDALGKVRDKLTAVLDGHPDANAHWAFIIPKTVNRSGSKVWKKKGTEDRQRLYKTWGSEVYRIVTGNSDDLLETYTALDAALSYISKEDKKDSLELIGSRILDLVKNHKDSIKEQVFSKTFVKK